MEFFCHFGGYDKGFYGKKFNKYIYIFYYPNNLEYISVYYFIKLINSISPKLARLQYIISY